MNVERSQDCGNPSKDLRAEDVGIALESASAAAIAEWVTRDVHWDLVDGAVLSGRDAVLEELNKRSAPTALRIEHVITHGKLGAVSGTVFTDEATACAFCDGLEFSTAACKTVTSIKSFSGPVLSVKESSHG